MVLRDVGHHDNSPLTGGPPGDGTLSHMELLHILGTMGLAASGDDSPSKFRGTPDCNESAALHSYGLDAHTAAESFAKF